MQHSSAKNFRAATRLYFLDNIIRIKREQKRIKKDPKRALGLFLLQALRQKNQQLAFV